MLDMGETVMIVDAHAHISKKGWKPEWYWELRAIEQAKSLGISLQQARQMEEERLSQGEEKSIKAMDEAGVDVMAICCWDCFVEGREEAPTCIEEMNREHYEITQRYPGRFVMAIGLDPRRRNVMEILEIGIRQFNAKALKLYPPNGFYPNDRICYPVYEKCSEYRLPVCFHTGPPLGMHGPFRSKYAHPIYLDDVATDFPDLTIHAVHAGLGSWHEMIAVALAKTNIVCDIAEWKAWLAISDKLRFYRELRWMMDMLGPGRLMFASDLVNGGNSGEYLRLIKAFTKIPEAVKEAGIEFTEKEMLDFLGGTATRVLNL
jgi:predicted TIM-barrel fold metal-dependent hydrolase